MARKKQDFSRRDEKAMREDPFVNDNEDEDEDDHEDLQDADGPPAIDPYEVLGLEQDATADHVKKAYRKLALKHHPGMSRRGRTTLPQRTTDAP